MICRVTNDLGQRLAASRRMTAHAHDWVLEGGAIDGDGTGLVVTTEQCLLNRNRNPGLSQGEIDGRLMTRSGVRPRAVAGRRPAERSYRRPCRQSRALRRRRAGWRSRSRTDNDPNWRVYQDAAQRAEAFGVEVVRLPSPGRVLNADEEIVPASYMNFYIGNAAVVVPVYGAAERRCGGRRDRRAVSRAAGGRPPRRRHPDRRRQLPLHQPADSGALSRNALPFGEGMNRYIRRHDRDHRRRAATRPSRPDIDRNIANVSRLVREAHARGRAGDPAARIVRGRVFLPRRGRGAVRATPQPTAEHKAVLAMQALADGAEGA